MTRDTGRWPSEPGSPGGPAQGADAGGGKPPVLEQLFDGDSLYALREAVAAHASQAGLPEGRVGDLVLAVHELAVNAVWHGAGHGRLRVWKTEDSLRCEVSDDGTASTARPGAAGSGPADTPAWTIEPDHGLWLVRQLADQASLRSGPGGTVAVVTITLERPGPLPFRLAQHARDGCTVLWVTGQLDLGSAGQLRSAVEELAATTPALRLILDLQRTGAQVHGECLIKSRGLLQRVSELGQRHQVTRSGPCSGMPPQDRSSIPGRAFKASGQAFQRPRQWCWPR